MNKNKEVLVQSRFSLSSEVVLRGICKSPSHLDGTCLKFLRDSGIKDYFLPKPFSKMSVNLLCYLMPLLSLEESCLWQSGRNQNWHLKAERLGAVNCSSEKVESESWGSRKAGRKKHIAEHNSRFQMLPAEPISITVAGRWSDTDKWVLFWKDGGPKRPNLAHWPHRAVWFLGLAKLFAEQSWRVA